VLTHGGFGTTMSALVHGIPLVVVPLGSDQPWNGANTKALGLSEVVEVADARP
jgi:UDP:flavonoid glycosyltransferase YjiC (YdhE family)